jgi:hypothetical protein
MVGVLLALALGTVAAALAMVVARALRLDALLFPPATSESPEATAARFALFIQHDDPPASLARALVGPGIRTPRCTAAAMLARALAVETARCAARGLDTAQTRDRLIAMVTPSRTTNPVAQAA